MRTRVLHIFCFADLHVLGIIVRKLESLLSRGASQAELPLCSGMHVYSFNVFFLPIIAVFLLLTYQFYLSACGTGEASVL